MTFAVVRVRGTVNVRGSISDTLKMLRLNKANHCVLIPESEAYKGMLQKVKDYVTWGEIDDKTLELLVKKRARVAGGGQLDGDYIKRNSGHKDVESFIKKLASGESKIKSVKGLKPVFRLKPPTKGFERAGIKKSYSVGGALGYRGDKINELLARMI